MPIREATWGRSTNIDPDAPVIYVYGRRVTESDVLANLRDLGGSALADYTSGRLSREEAYRMTADWLRQMKELSR